MSRRVRNAIPPLALTLTVCAVLAGCGFNDTLTTRGFIASGDQICIDTFVKNGLALQARPNVTGSQFLGSIANAFDQAAPRFQRLDVRSDDEPMRARIVTDYRSFARRLHAAARAPSAASQSAQAQATFSAISVLARAMKDYGFQACGGPPGAARQ